MPSNKLGHGSPPPGTGDTEMGEDSDTGPINSSQLPQFHLRRIGRQATRPGVADIMDFYRITYMIGRNPSQVNFLIDSSDHVQSASISRCHARVVRQVGNHHRLYDDSLNGIFVNHIKIAGSCILREGDRVTFGHPFGMKFPAGTRQRQPNSEHQFLFERCMCRQACDENGEENQKTAKQPSHTNDEFKKPGTSSTEGHNTPTRGRKRGRITTQSFTSEDIRGMRDIWNQLQGRQDQEVRQDNEEGETSAEMGERDAASDSNAELADNAMETSSAQEENESPKDESVVDEGVSVQSKSCGGGDDDDVLANAKEATHLNTRKTVDLGVQNSDVGKIDNAGGSVVEPDAPVVAAAAPGVDAEDCAQQLVKQTDQGSTVSAKASTKSPSKHASVQTVNVLFQCEVVSPSKDVGIQTSQSFTRPQTIAAKLDIETDKKKADHNNANDNDTENNSSDFKEVFQFDSNEDMEVDDEEKNPEVISEKILPCVGLQTLNNSVDQPAENAELNTDISAKANDFSIVDERTEYESEGSKQEDRDDPEEIGRGNDNEESSHGDETYSEERKQGLDNEPEESRHDNDTAKGTYGDEICSVDERFECVQFDKKACEDDCASGKETVIDSSEEVKTANERFGNGRPFSIDRSETELEEENDADQSDEFKLVQHDKKANDYGPNSGNEDSKDDEGCEAVFLIPDDVIDKNEEVKVGNEGPDSERHDKTDTGKPKPKHEEEMDSDKKHEFECVQYDKKASEETFRSENEHVEDFTENPFLEATDSIDYGYDGDSMADCLVSVDDLENTEEVKTVNERHDDDRQENIDTGRSEIEHEEENDAGGPVEFEVVQYDKKVIEEACGSAQRGAKDDLECEAVCLVSDDEVNKIAEVKTVNERCYTDNRLDKIDTGKPESEQEEEMDNDECDDFECVQYDKNANENDCSSENEHIEELTEHPFLEATDSIDYGYDGDSMADCLVSDDELENSKEVNTDNERCDQQRQENIDTGSSESDHEEEKDADRSVEFEYVQYVKRNSERIGNFAKRLAEDEEDICLVSFDDHENIKEVKTANETHGSDTADNTGTGRSEEPNDAGKIDEFECEQHGKNAVEEACRKFSEEEGAKNFTESPFLAAADSIDYDYDAESEANCLVTDDETETKDKLETDNEASDTGRCSSVYTISDDEIENKEELMTGVDKYGIDRQSSTGNMSDDDKMIKEELKTGGDSDGREDFGTEINVGEKNSEKQEMKETAMDVHEVSNMAIDNSEEGNENSNESEKFDDPFVEEGSSMKRKRSDRDTDEEEEEETGSKKCHHEEMNKSEQSNVEWFSLKTMEWVHDPFADFKMRMSKILEGTVRDFFESYRNSDMVSEVSSPEKELSVKLGCSERHCESEEQEKEMLADKQEGDKSVTEEDNGLIKNQSKYAQLDVDEEESGDSFVHAAEGGQEVVIASERMEDDAPNRRSSLEEPATDGVNIAKDIPDHIAIETVGDEVIDAANDRVDASVCCSDDDIESGEEQIRKNWLTFSTLTPSKHISSTQECSLFSPVIKAQSSTAFFNIPAAKSQKISKQTYQLSCQFSDSDSDGFPDIDLGPLDKIEEAANATLAQVFVDVERDTGKKGENQMEVDEGFDALGDDSVSDPLANLLNDDTNVFEEIPVAEERPILIDSESETEDVTILYDGKGKCPKSESDSNGGKDFVSKSAKRKCNFTAIESNKKRRPLTTKEQILECSSEELNVLQTESVAMEMARPASPTPGCSYILDSQAGHLKSVTCRVNDSFSCTQFIDNIDTASSVNDLTASQMTKVNDRLKVKVNAAANVLLLSADSKRKVRDLLEKMKNKKKQREVKEEPLATMETEFDDCNIGNEAVAPGLQFDENTSTIEQHVQSCQRVIEGLKKTFGASPTLKSNPRIQAWSEDLGELEMKLKFPKTIIAVVGDTGSGKSSLMNAILDHRSVLPTSGIRACTAVVVEVVQNVTNTNFEADIEFLQRKEWFDELKVLLQDLTSVDGTIKKQQPDPTSDAHVSYCKIKAVYGRIDTFEILSRINAVTHWLGKVKVVSSKNPEDFRCKVERYIETQEPGSGGQYWPIVKHVRLRMPHCDVCSSGAALVDLPGVRDSNAARDKIAREYLKNCTAVWVVSSIHRAIDDKTAKDLLGESFRRQLLMDGQYGSIAFICTKTDVLMPSEIIRSLNLENETKKHEDKVMEMEQEKADLDFEVSNCDFQVARLGSEVKDVEAEVEELESTLTELEKLIEPVQEDEDETEEHVLMKEYQAELSGKKIQIKEEYEKPMEDYMVRKSTAMQKVMQLEKELGIQRRTIAAVCAKARNEYSKHEIRRDFRAGLKEMKRRAGMMDEEEEEDDPYDEEEDDDEEIGSSARNLRVFCCSSTEYQKMKKLLTDDGPPQVFNNVADTQIPDVRSYVHEMTRIRRQQALERLIRGLGRFVFDIQSYTADGNLKGHANRQGAKSLINTQLRGFEATVTRVMERLSKDIDVVFDGSIRQKLELGAANGKEEASDICAKWGAPMNRDKTQDRRTGGLAWSTYRATTRRQGVYKSPTFGLIDFNEELSEPMMRSLTIVWDKAFSGMLWRILDKTRDSIVEELRDFTGGLCRQLERCGVARVRSGRVCAQFLGSAEHQLTEMVGILKEDITTNQREISRQVTPQIQEAMMPTYDVCAGECGKGMFMRMKSQMTSGVDSRRRTMFDEATRNMMQALVELESQIINAVKVSCDHVVKNLKVAFEPLWDATANSQELRAALVRPMEEVCHQVRQIYDEAGMRNNEEQTDETSGVQESGETSGSGLGSLSNHLGNSSNLLQPDRQYPSTSSLPVDHKSQTTMVKDEKKWWREHTSQYAVSDIKTEDKNIPGANVRVCEELLTFGDCPEGVQMSREMSVSTVEEVVHTSPRIKTEADASPNYPAISRELLDARGETFNQMQQKLSSLQNKKIHGRIITFDRPSSKEMKKVPCQGIPGTAERQRIQLLPEQNLSRVHGAGSSTVLSGATKQGNPTGCLVKLPDGRMVFVQQASTNTSTTSSTTIASSDMAKTLSYVPIAPRPVPKNVMPSLASVLNPPQVAENCVKTRLPATQPAKPVQSNRIPHLPAGQASSQTVSALASYVHGRQASKPKDTIVINQGSMVTSRTGIITSQNSTVTNQKSMVTNQNSKVANQIGVATSQSSMVTKQTSTVTGPFSTSPGKENTVIDKSQVALRQNSLSLTNRNLTASQKAASQKPSSPVTIKTEPPTDGVYGRRQRKKFLGRIDLTLDESD